MLKIVSKEPVPLSVLTPSRSLHLFQNVPKDIDESELPAVKEQYPDARIMVLSETSRRQVVKPPSQKVVEFESELEPIKNESEYSEVSLELINKSVNAIISDLDEKERLMDTDEYRILLQELLDLENEGDVNRESPRVTLIRHLEIKLEQ